MAIFHCHAKYFSRRKGQSATRAAAYRAGERITDERTGANADYTKKAVAYSEIITPDNSPAPDRSELWNRAEKAEKRKDATVAREIEIALPVELTPTERQALAREMAQTIARAENCVVDMCIHENPGNPHAHFLTPTRQGPELGPKINATVSKAEREKRGLTTTPEQDLERLRATIADQINNALAAAGVDARVDHRSLADQGRRDEAPTIHLGAAAAAQERQGIKTDRGDINRERLKARRPRLGALISTVKFRPKKPKPRPTLDELGNIEFEFSNGQTMRPH